MKLKYSNSKAFEAILGMETTLTNEKHLYLTSLKTTINWYVMHSLFFLSLISVSHGNLRIFFINFEH